MMVFIKEIIANKMQVGAFLNLPFQIGVMNGMVQILNVSLMLRQAVHFFTKGLYHQRLPGGPVKNAPDHLV